MADDIRKRAITIGYQGDVGSNAEEAARAFKTHLEYTDLAAFLAEPESREQLLPTVVSPVPVRLFRVKMEPLITSAAVFEALKNGRIDFGVCATENSIGGPVAETVAARARAAGEGWRTKVLDELGIAIHHCLFIAPGHEGAIQAVASHEQALAQTFQWRRTQVPDADGIEIVDTAYAAKLLAQGELPPTTAVLCHRDAGARYGLSLVAKDVEDQESITTFKLFRLEQAG